MRIYFKYEHRTKKDFDIKTKSKKMTFFVCSEFPALVSDFIFNSLNKRKEKKKTHFSS